MRQWAVIFRSSVAPAADRQAETTAAYRMKETRFAESPAIAARAGWVRKATVIVAAMLGFGLLSMALTPLCKETPQVAHNAPAFHTPRPILSHPIQEARQGKDRLGSKIMGGVSSLICRRDGSRRRHLCSFGASRSSNYKPRSQRGSDIFG